VLRLSREKISNIGDFVCDRQMDGQMDGQTDIILITSHLIIPCSTVKIGQPMLKLQPKILGEIFFGLAVNITDMDRIWIRIPIVFN